MRLPLRRRKRVPDVSGLKEAQRARVDAERSLRETLADLIEPLREMREVNGITEDVRLLIEKRVEERGR